jgi:hypothetical protein
LNAETSFALLGALIAVAVVLLALVVFGGVVAVRVVGYIARFKGFQGNRNAKNEMTFTAVVDETPPPAPGSLIIRAQDEPPAPEALN